MIGVIGTVTANKPRINVNRTVFNCATQKILFQGRTISMIQILLFFRGHYFMRHQTNLDQTYLFQLQPNTKYNLNCWCMQLCCSIAVTRGLKLTDWWLRIAMPETTCLHEPWDAVTVGQLPWPSLRVPGNMRVGFSTNLGIWFFWIIQ